MTRCPLDTDHAGTPLRDGQGPLWSKLRGMSPAECFLYRPVVAELWFTVANGARADSNRAVLDALFARLGVVASDAAAAVEFARIRAELRRAARPIPAFGILVAAIATAHHPTVVAADAHSRAVPSVKTENRPAPTSSHLPDPSPPDGAGSADRSA